MYFDSMTATVAIMMLMKQKSGDVLRPVLRGVVSIIGQLSRPYYRDRREMAGSHKSCLKRNSTSDGGASGNNSDSELTLPQPAPVLKATPGMTHEFALNKLLWGSMLKVFSRNVL